MFTDIFKYYSQTYGALLQGRAAMVVDSGNVAKKALTIAIRYAAVRRQFATKANQGVETKLLDYPIHQRRLMPLLAQAFAMHFTGTEMMEMYLSLMDKLESASPEDADLQEVLENLKETHATSAGLKAFCTWNCLNTIEQCRQACGGHGYSAYTGLAGMYQDFAVQCTWEGDNTILTLQAGRYLIGSYREGQEGKKLGAGVAYLNRLDQLIGKKCSVKNVEDVASIEVITEAWDVVCANVVQNAAQEFAQCVKSGVQVDEAFEQCSQSRLYAAKLHSYGYLFKKFTAGISKASDDLRNVLVDVCLLYGLYTIEDNAGAFLQYEYFSPTQISFIRSKVNELCKTVREQAIPLVDAFNYSDYIVNSPLGRKDGNVYVHYFAQVKQQNPPQDHPYFDRLIKPLIHRKANEDDDDEDEEGGLEDEDDEEDAE